MGAFRFLTINHNSSVEVVISVYQIQDELLTARVIVVAEGGLPLPLLLASPRLLADPEPERAALVRALGPLGPSTPYGRLRRLRVDIFILNT